MISDFGRLAKISPRPPGQNEKQYRRKLKRFVDQGYVVTPITPSQAKVSGGKRGDHIVELKWNDQFSCDCVGAQRGVECVHIIAVKVWLEVNVK